MVVFKEKEMNEWIGRKVVTMVESGDIPKHSIGKIAYTTKYNVFVNFPNHQFGQWYTLDELDIM